MDSVKLFFREFGNSTNKLVILHGLYGSSDNWVSIARQLEKDFHVFALDQRNHGHSPHTSSHTYEDMVADLLQFVEEQHLDEINLLGHSMGGKTAMRFALQYPNLIKKLIIADISPRSYSDKTNYGEITNNHKFIVDTLLALHPESMSTRQEIDARLALSIPSPDLRHFLLKNIDRTAQGQFRWRFNLPVLAQSLTEVMDGFSNLPDELTTSTETVFIKGELSPYIMDEDLLMARKRFKGAQTVTIPGAGHWLHAEKPDLFLKTVEYFLD